MSAPHKQSSTHPQSPSKKGLAMPIPEGQRYLYVQSLDNSRKLVQRITIVERTKLFVILSQRVGFDGARRSKLRISQFDSQRHSLWPGMVRLTEDQVLEDIEKDAIGALRVSERRLNRDRTELTKLRARIAKRRRAKRTKARKSTK